MILVRLIALFIIIILSGSGLQSCSKKAGADRSLQSAKRFYAKSDFAAAEIELKNALRADPGNHEAIRIIGFILSAQGNSLEAARMLHRAKSSFPNDDDLGVALSKSLLEMGFVADSRQEARDVFSRSPDNEAAMIFLAETSVRAEWISETEEILAAVGNPNAPAHRLAQALLNLRKGQIETGRSQLYEVIEAHPENARAHSLLTTLLTSEGKFEEALDSAKRASELSGPRSNESIAYINLLMSRKMAEEALAELEKITTKTPDFLPAWCTLGLVKQSQGDQEAAEEYFSKVLSINPFDLKAAVAQSQIWSSKGEPEKTIKLLTNFTQALQSRPLIDYELARAYLASDQITRAASALDRVLAISPGTADAASLRARIYLEDEQTFKGISILKKVLEKTPENLKARDLLVQAYRASGETDSAIALLKENLPGLEEPQRRIDLSILLTSQERISEARLILEECVREHPDHLALVAQLASLDLAEGKSETAADRIDNYIASHPDSSEAVVFRAGIALNEEQFDRADGLLRKALELQPDSAPAYSLLLRLKSQTNRDDEALEVLEQYATFYPEDSNALLELANVQQRLGKNEDAVVTLERLIQAQPEFAAAYNNLAEIKSEILVDLDAAASYARKARKLDDRQPAIADTLGWIEWKLGNYPKALSLLEQAAAGISTNPSILYHVGRAQYSLGNAADARNSFEMSLSGDEDFPGKAEAVQFLDLLNKGKGASAAELSSQVSENPGDVVLLMQLAASHAREGEPELALQTYQEAFAQSPSLAEALAGQSELYAGPLKNPDLALETALSARKISPRSPRVLAALGTARFLTDSFQEAYGLLRDANDKFSDNAEVRFHLGRSAYSLGRITEARDLMDWVASSETAKSSDAEIFLVLTDPEAKKVPDIDSIITQALASDSNRVPALMLRGSLEIARNQDAEPTYQQVLKLHPNLDQARVRLAAIYLADPEKLEQANLMAIKARQSLTDDPELTSLMADINYRMGDYKYAVQQLNTLGSVRQLQARELFVLGMSQSNLGSDDAEATLQKAISTGLQESDNVQAVAALKALRSTVPDSQ